MKQNEIFNTLSTGIILLDPNKPELVTDINIVASEMLVLDLEALDFSKNEQELAKRHANLYKILKQIQKSEFISPELNNKKLAKYHVLARKRVELNSNGEYLNIFVSLLKGMTYLLEITKHQQKDLGATTHELKRPLQNIKTSVETLLMGAKDDPEPCLKFLNNINNEADRLGKLVNDLLKLSSLNSSSIDLKIQKMKLKTCVSQIIAQLQNKAKEKEITLINKLGDELEINADQDLYEHLLENLIDNAIKYNKPKGSVYIEKDEDYLVIRDNGIGIAEEDLGKICEQFYRVKEVQSTPGSGLGLAIVQNIVDLHNSELKIESKPGKGTSFKIRL